MQIVLFLNSFLNVISVEGNQTFKVDSKKKHKIEHSKISFQKLFM